MTQLAADGASIRRRVLVVDDELINRRMLGHILESAYEVLYAENGREALEVMRTQRRTISLVLLDLLMPQMDGYELLEIIRGDEDLRRIPVIVLTSEKSAEVRSLQLGAADFITKPYDMPEVILARVRRSIELAEDSSIIHATEKDALTGLYNRDFFFQYCHQRDWYQPDMDMDAMVLNINRFHLLNELHGRTFGDNVLRALSDQLRAILAESTGIACRSIADTFYLYVAHREDYDALLTRIAGHLNAEFTQARIQIRMGVYAHADHAIDPEQRFDRAAVACNTLRTQYLTNFSVYDNTLHEQELYAEQLIENLDAALKAQQFRVFYQPKYNILGEKPVLCSAEALIRWFHPEHGMISPGVFIPLFEENGLVQKIDRFVWREAAAQIRAWKERYGFVVPVSVNVSRVDIYDPNLEDELLEIMRENGLKPEEYLLEITESAYTDATDQIISTVNKLREDGFHVEMDDFGSGYSSLNMLTSLPIDTLKLDMRFIRNICTNPKDYKMVELILGIAKFLSVPVVAEGVETEDQYKLLRQAGCDIIQGYYFSKPVPPEEFAAFILKQQRDNQEQGGENCAER